MRTRPRRDNFKKVLIALQVHRSLPTPAPVMDICIPDASTSTGHIKKGAGGFSPEMFRIFIKVPIKRKCHPETIKTFNSRGFF